MRVFYFGILVSLLSLPQSMQIILVDENCVNGYVHQVFIIPLEVFQNPQHQLDRETDIGRCLQVLVVSLDVGNTSTYEHSYRNLIRNATWAAIYNTIFEYVIT